MSKKTYIIFLFLNIVFYAKAQDSKEQKKHKEKIEKSFKKQSAEVSLDTLFYKGLPNCIYKITDKSFIGPNEISVFSLKNNIECFKIKMMSVGEGSATVYTWKWVVTLPNNNTVIDTKFGEMPYDLIAKYKVMNDSSINENGLKTFVSMEAIDKTVKVQIVQPNAKPLLVERNRTASIIIINESIKQDNQQIGVIKSSTKTQNGNMTEVYFIYNMQNVLIATAENEAFMGHHWHVVTASNNQMGHINSSSLEDKNDIVKYLIENLYL